VPLVSAPAQQVSYLFPYQSYFDDTLLQTAILSQPKNSPIVSPQTMALSGFSFALHPSSETPVAVTFTTNAQGGGSQVYFLKPGEVITPSDNAFSGFTWGLPFGWLGGGVATILIFPNKMGQARWHTDAELIIQRSRYAIVQPGAIPATFPKNWPMHFPWANAFSSSINQNGSPTAAVVRPTKIIMALRGTSSLAAPADFRLMWQGSNDFGLDSTGAFTSTNYVFEDYTWPIFSAVGGLTAAPMIVSEKAAARIGADLGGVSVIDMTGAATLTGLFVDIVRYGKL